jgi:D-alanyl-D-alanine dipeptidase
MSERIYRILIVMGLAFALSLANVCNPLWAADSPTELVDLSKIDFTIKQRKCILRRPVAEALNRAQSMIKLGGFSLAAVVCYIPKSKSKLVAEGPDGKDDTSHSRGGAVDMTLGQGSEEAVMPKAIAGGPKNNIMPGSDSDRARIAQKNLLRLQTVMEKEGFKNSKEAWWHFTYKDSEKYEPSDVPLSAFE